MSELEYYRRLARERLGEHADVVLTTLGTLIACDRRDRGVSENLLRDKEHEAKLLRSFLSRIKDGDVVVIGGSNIGVYDCAVARQFPNCVIASYEPNPNALEYLMSNVEMNQFSNIDIVACALGHAMGSAFIWQWPGNENLGGASLAQADDKAVLATSVKVVRLDSVYWKIDVLKLDLQGSECYAIRGASNILEDPERRPREIVIEWENGAELSHVDYLLGLGYRCYILESTLEDRPGEIKSSQELVDFEYAEVRFWQ